MILEEILNIKSDKPELRKFGITIGIVLLLIGLVLLYYSKAACFYFIIIGFMLVASGILAPVILLPLQKLWMIFSILLGFVMTRVILSVLFYLVLTPMNIIARLFGKRFLDLRFNKEKRSYWNKREIIPYNKIDSERQF